MVKKNAEKDVGFVRQFNELKKKHPDAVLLFRKGDFYEMYKEDALKASVILALKVSDKILPLEKDPIKLLTFPRHELDKHLPKLIRSGQRVAICEAIDRPELMKKPKEKTGEELKSQDKVKKKTISIRKLWRKEERTGCAGRANQDSQDGCRGETCQGKEDGSQSRSQE